MIRNSSPSSLISVPEYLPNRMRSPALTSSGTDLAFVVGFAVAGGDDFALLRLVLGAIGNDDATTGGLGFLYATYKNPVMQGGELR